MQFVKLACVIYPAHIVYILLRWTDGSKLNSKTILWVHQYYKIGPDWVPLLNQTWAQMYKSFWNVRWNTCPRPGSWICDENEWQTVSTGRIFVTEVQRPAQWAQYPSSLPPIQRLSVLECGGRESAGAPRCPTTLSGGRRHRRLHFEECLVGRLAGMCLQEAPGWNFEGVGTTTCSLIRLLGKQPYKRTILQQPHYQYYWGSWVGFMFKNVFWVVWRLSGLRRLKNPPANGIPGSTNCFILPSWMGEHEVRWENMENMENMENTENMEKMENINHMT